MKHMNFVTTLLYRKHCPIRPQRLLEEEELLDNHSVVPGIAAAVSLADRLHIEDDYVTTNDWSAPWSSTPSRIPGFRLNAAPSAVFPAMLNGARVEARLQSARQGDQTWRVELAEGETTAQPISDGIRVGDDDGVSMAPWPLGEGQFSVMFRRGEAYEVRPYRYQPDAASGPASDGSLRAPMPGKVVATPAAAGDTVAKGAPIVVVEAMKMEHALTAPFDGVVETISVAVGEQVADGTILAVVRKMESNA